MWVFLPASILFSQGTSVTIKKSFISVYNLKDKTTDVVYNADQVIEAPNWSPDGKKLLVNTGGSLFNLVLNSGSSPKLEKIDVGGVTRCNNDKGFSPDGKLLAFSARGSAAGSQVYTVPADGGSRS